MLKSHTEFSPLSGRTSGKYKLKILKPRDRQVIQVLQILQMMRKSPFFLQKTETDLSAMETSPGAVGCPMVFYNGSLPGARGYTP